MVVDAEGVAFVGNFGFDLDAELTARGMESVLADHPTAKLARIAPDGSAEVAATDMHFPNGSVITPDGKTLIVGESFGACLTAFDIDDAGFLTGRRLWADLRPRVPDGICLDADGAVWVANPIAPECVLVAEGGEVREVIETGDPCYACMLGGDDGRTLFMLTAPTSIAEEAAASPKGKLLITTVDAPHAGLP
jgi:sugar lactone lactonase YvrE